MCDVVYPKRWYYVSSERFSICWRSTNMNHLSNSCIYTGTVNINIIPNLHILISI